jgi:SAM-dependent methyltransferase
MMAALMASSETSSSPKDQLLSLLADAVLGGTFVKLTLGSPRDADASLQNIFIRPVALRNGPRLSFVYRHATRDITQNLRHEEGLARIGQLLERDFRTAHFFTTEYSAQFECRDGKKPRLILAKPSHATPAAGHHDRARNLLIDPRESRWLNALGVATSEGKIAKGMEAKFRQINKFVELLQHLLADAGEAFSLSVAGQSVRPALSLVDMGCGKGYLTFAAYEYLRRAGGRGLTVRGSEARAELVEFCNRVARDSGFDGLRFEAGSIADAQLEHVDVLVALHACDTATDDALAKGIQAGASLMLVAPCCHKELRPQLRPPPALAGALRHGILRERQAEFVTDALRAALLEWAGYDTKVFEFISTEHTSKNLMIAATKRSRAADRGKREQNVRDLAAFYGIRSQRLAERLGFNLAITGVNRDD